MTKVLFQTTDWDSLPAQHRKGESGIASFRSMEFEGFRVRIVEYSSNYRADHWCRAGHIVYCIEGEMISELADGRKFTLSKGMSYIVSNDASVHRTYTENGVKLMIVDGNFLGARESVLFNPWKM
jgi:mannose-6-phosphate isomerase class I